MIRNNCEIKILVKGNAITEYAHQGNFFIEGRKDSVFEIEFKNNNPFRVEAVISVDGQSVIDGKEAGINSSGYVVDAHATLIVPGWKVSDEKAAKFVFSGKGESYSTVMTGTSKNNGVIGVMVFKDRSTPTHHYVPNTNIPHYCLPYNGQVYGGGYVQGTTTDLQSSWTTQQFGQHMLGSATIGATANMLSTYSSSAPSASLTGATVKSQLARSATQKTKSVEQNSQLSQQNLGTGFGDATSFKTETVSFQRGDMVCMAVLYYDDRTGLKRRGVPVARRYAEAKVTTPQAFPGMNCAPPPGWRG